MRFVTATTTSDVPAQAARELVDGVQAELGSATRDLACLFMTPHYAHELEEMVESLHRDLAPEHLVGCTAESVIGGGEEFERGPAATLWVASLPGIEVETTHIRFEQTLDGYLFAAQPQFPPDARGLVLFCEPHSFPAHLFLKQLAESHQELPVVGGMASGSRSPGENRLFHGGRVHVHGAVAARLSGPICVRPVVSQGCRPIGKTCVVTKADDNVIFELGGRPALEQLMEIVRGLPSHEQTLVEQGLHIGIAVDAGKNEQRRGDFLVRAVVGIDRDRGAVAIGDHVRPGQTVQFHIRDAESASEDLRELLDVARAEGAAPRGALLFTCNGRGRRLFDEEHHDASRVFRGFSQVPLGGFFAAGELGPIGSRNFVHGFTASIALFEHQQERQDHRRDRMRP